MVKGQRGKVAEWQSSRVTGVVERDGFQCIICSGPHKVEEHCCGVPGCNKGKGKTCAHVTVKCANYRGGHSANSNRCTERHKAEMRARKNKVLSKSKTRIVEPNDKANPDPDKASPEPEACPSLEASPAPEEVSPSPEEVTPDPDIEIDLAPE